MKFYDKPVPPGHIADGRYSREIVGPIVYFRSRTIPVTVAKSPPASTSDGDRWQNCTDHHLACDCREAEKNEDLRELQADMRMIREALTQATFGHPTFVEEVRYRDSPVRRRDLECKCAGCDVIRRLTSSHAMSFYDNTVQI